MGNLQTDNKKDLEKYETEKIKKGRNIFIR